MKVLVLRRPQRFEAEVIDDEESYFSELIKLSVIRLGGPGGIEPSKHGALGGEGDVVALSYGAMTESLSEVTFAGSTGSNDKDRDLLLDEAAGGKIHDESSVDGRVEGEVKVLDGFLISEVGASQGESESFLCSSGDLILDDHGEEVGVGCFLFDGLTVSLFEGIEDSGEPQFLEQGNQFGHRMHDGPPFSGCSGCSSDVRIAPCRCTPRQGIQIKAVDGVVGRALF